MSRYPVIMFLALALNIGVAFSAQCVDVRTAKYDYANRTYNFDPNSAISRCHLSAGMLTATVEGAINSSDYSSGRKIVSISGSLFVSYSSTRLGYCNADYTHQQDVSFSNSASASTTTLNGIQSYVEFDLPEWDGCNVNWYAQGFSGSAIVVCNFVYTGGDCRSDNLPQCSSFLPVDNAECNGGKGFEMQTSTGNAEFELLGIFGTIIDNKDGTFKSENGTMEGSLEYSHYQTADFDTLTRSDGSLCSSNTTGNIYTIKVCPGGFADPSSSSSSEEDSSSSSMAGVSSSSENCLVWVGGVCVEDGDGGDGGEGGSGGSSDSGVMVGDAACFRTPSEASHAIGVLSNACLSGKGKPTYIVNSTAYRGYWCVVGECNGYGIGGEGDCDGLVGVIKEIFTNDCDDGGFGDDDGSGLLGDLSYGREMTDELGDGSYAKQSIEDAIGIKGDDFSFFGNGGACPVWNLSFNAGVVACNNCVVELCNIHGFNAGAVLKSIFWLFVEVSILFMNLQVLKTGGRS